MSARLRQAQGTLDQIASAARLLNGGGAAALPATPAPAAATPPPAGSPLTPAPGTQSGRVHVVAEGDSLTRISARYYGTANRWQEIYEANRDTLAGQNSLRPGQRLRVP